MSVGDILHILIIDETGGPIEIELSGDEDNYAPSAPIALDATDIAETSFTANWYFNENTTGYYLDVATDSAFSSMVTGYDNKDVLNVDSASVTGLTGATTYYYRLRAYNDYGTSPNSNIITTNTLNVYGALYNWYAVIKNGGSGVGSIAPIGWHVPTGMEQFPSDMDYRVLTKFIAPPWGFVSSRQMREVGTTHWAVPNTGATNSSGFTLLGAGARLNTGVFYSKNIATYLWYSDPFTLGDVITYDETDTQGASNIGVNGGGSIRCIMNGINPDNPGIVTDIDGNVYPTVKIGTQVWMASNLNVTHYNDGTPIPIITDDGTWAADTTGAMCWYNNVAP